MCRRQESDGVSFSLRCSCSAALQRRGRSVHPGPPPGCGSVGNCTQTLINDGTGGVRIKASLTLPVTAAKDGGGGVGGACCVGVSAGLIQRYQYRHFKCLVSVTFLLGSNPN